MQEAQLHRCWADPVRPQSQPARKWFTAQLSARAATHQSQKQPSCLFLASLHRESPCSVVGCAGRQVVSVIGDLLERMSGPMWSNAVLAQFVSLQQC